MKLGFCISIMSFAVMYPMLTMFNKDDIPLTAVSCMISLVTFSHTLTLSFSFYNQAYNFFFPPNRVVHNRDEDGGVLGLGGPGNPNQHLPQGESCFCKFYSGNSGNCLSKFFLGNSFWKFFAGNFGNYFWKFFLGNSGNSSLKILLPWKFLPVFPLFPIFFFRKDLYQSKNFI